MGIDAAEEIPSAMDVQHDPPARIPSPLPLLKIGAHLDPLGSHLAAGPTPLPPVLPTDPLDAMRTELGVNGFSAGREVFGRDRDLVQLDPARRRHPLPREALDVLDRMVRGIK